MVSVSAPASLRRPNLFIVGAPKSGTTSLYEYLAGHPQVYMSPVKEPMYFAPDVRRGRFPRLEFGVDEARYLELFAAAGDAIRVGEATTRYLASVAAPGLVHEFEPRALIVAMLRNPVEMMYALHNERLSNLNEDIADFAEAMEADDDRRAGKRLPPGSNPLGAVYGDSARYAEQLARWFQIFDRDRVHVIVFDDFVADTAASFRGLLQFLEVDPEYTPESFAPRNVSHRQRRWLRRLLAAPPSQWAKEHVLPAVIGRNAQSRLALRFRQSRLSRRRVPRPPLPPDLRRRLEIEFSPEVSRLSEMLGRDLVSLWFGGRV